MSDSSKITRRHALVTLTVAGVATALIPRTALSEAIGDSTAALRARREDFVGVRRSSAERVATTGLKHHFTNHDEEELLENGRKT